MKEERMKLIELAQIKLAKQDRSLSQSDAVYRAGWDGCGEWTCALCGHMIGKNLNGDMPFWLAKEHSKNCQNLD